jgi:hypothetical protein
VCRRFGRTAKAAGLARRARWALGVVERNRRASASMRYGFDGLETGHSAKRASAPICMMPTGGAIRMREARTPVRSSSSSEARAVGASPKDFQRPVPPVQGNPEPAGLD